MLFILVAGGLLLAACEPGTITVPDVTGKAQSAAELVIMASGLVTGEVTGHFSDTVPEGKILTQSPSAGTDVSPGSAVDLTLSKGEERVQVPDVTGQTQGHAESNLLALGLGVGEVTHQPSDTIPPGLVILQVPAAGLEATPGARVNLVLSTGLPQVIVPNVVGHTQAAAEAYLTEAGLTVGTVTTQTSATVPEGITISQEPSTGIRVEPGSAVDLIISSGQEKVTVPNVAGQSLADAEVMLDAAALRTGEVSEEYHPSAPKGDVIAQLPQPGIRVTVETAIDLVVSKGPNPNVVVLGKRLIETASPNYVSLLFQALDASGRGIPDLTVDSLRLLEDGQPVVITDTAADFLKQDSLPYTHHTVLMLDNSASTGDGLVQTRAAAKSFVNAMGPNHAVAVYTFSDIPRMLCDFTGIDDKQVILDAIDGVTVDVAAPNLYQAVIEGVGQWPRLYSQGEISQGALVLFTAGDAGVDTATLEQAVEARGSRRCYAIGLGTEVNPAALEALGNAGYFHLDDASQLETTLLDVQDAIEAYANSLYLLRYSSAARGAQSHTLHLEVLEPLESNTLEASFDSQPFYTVSPGIYINDGFDSHEGISAFDFQEGPGQQVEFRLDSHGGAPGVESVFAVQLPPSPIVRVVSVAGGQVILEAIAPGQSSVTFRDSANDFQTVVLLTVAAVVPDVRGITESEAVAALEAAGLRGGEIAYVIYDRVSSGIVIGQVPAPAQRLATGAEVTLTVSQYRVVPELLGLTESAARAALEEAGLSVGEVNTVPSISAPLYQVLEQEPATGQLLSPNAAVSLLVSSGPPKTEVIMLPGDVPLELVEIPRGTFTMGCSPDNDSWQCEDAPQHEVTFSRDFLIGQYEVTKAQWKAVMGTRPWNGHGYDPELPEGAASGVSWVDAQNFVSALNAYTGETFRLPTEAEWEYACRARTTTRFYWGTDPDLTEIDKYAWWSRNAEDLGEEYAHEVGLLLPNDWGLCDMAGNVLEWCQDWFGDYPEGPVTDPTGAEFGTNRIHRGGGWYIYSTLCCSGRRHKNSPTYGFYACGFRVVK